jgi:hypothetical protein
MVFENVAIAFNIGNAGMIVSWPIRAWEGDGTGLGAARQA